MTSQLNDSPRICNWCGLSEYETDFQKNKSQKRCSPCRAGVDVTNIRSLPVYYVYIHHCPYTNDILYVGKGSGRRAYECWGSGSRDPDHAEWFYEMFQRGFKPDQLVTVKTSGHYWAEAEDLEAIMKQTLKPNNSLKFCKDIK